MTDPVIFQRSLQVRFRVVDGEGVALLQDAGELILVNETGALILELLEQPMTVVEVIREIEERVDASREILDCEIPPFLLELEEVGAIERKKPAKDHD